MTIETLAIVPFNLCGFQVLHAFMWLYEVWEAAFVEERFMDTELKSLDLPCGVEEFCKIQAILCFVHLLARRFQCRPNPLQKCMYCFVFFVAGYWGEKGCVFGDVFELRPSLTVFGWIFLYKSLNADNVSMFPSSVEIQL